MNYGKTRASVLKTLKRVGATGVRTRTAASGAVMRETYWGVRIERRIGDLKKYDESVEIGDYKYIFEGGADIKESDMLLFGGESRYVSRIEELKPTDTAVLLYVWTREA